MEGNSIASYENLCRIFEMRIKLDKEKGVKTPLDVLDNYEKYSKKIDSVYNSEFQKEIKSLISPAVTLEKEEDRLRRLIRLLQDRLDRRVELEDRYYEATGKYITGLQIIVSESELDEKRERLSLISRYLETSKEIDSVTENINKLNDLLDEELTKKEQYESKNKLMEDELYSSLMSVLKDDEYYNGISAEDISGELDIIRSRVSETKETLDITRDSVGSLIDNGLEDDYSSYVEEAERGYYSYKNKELILKIYKLVIDFEDDFKLICSKREKISELLDEMKALREGLSIETNDDLFSFEKVLLVQKDTLDAERDVLENIANYESRIKFKEERLEELNEVNSSVEILSILREYGLVETYDTIDVTDGLMELEEEEVVDTSLNEEVVPVLDISEIHEEPIADEVYNPYRIVEVKDYPRTLNVGLAKLKGESVREKVNKKLNPVSEENALEEIVSDSSDVPSETNDMINTFVPINDIGESINDSKEDVGVPVVPFVEEEASASTPVWELPTEVDVKPIALEDANNTQVPIWDSIKPIMEKPNSLDNFEEIGSFDISSKPEDSNDMDMNAEANNMFWTPISESKIEVNSFPNLNIPINNGFNGNDNFQFPSINN